MWRAFWGLILLVGLFLSPGPASAQKSYSADGFDVDARVEEGGSLRVQEHVTFRFSGGPFSFVFRELPLVFADGITDIVAGVDGQTWPSGTGPGQVEITGSDPLRVTWHLPETSDTVGTFDLSYRLLGVVSQAWQTSSQAGPQADMLKWRPLPDSYEYPIARSKVMVDYPSDLVLLAAPSVNVGTALIEEQPGQVSFTSGRLAPDTPLEIELSFPPGSIISSPPAWQVSQIEQEAYTQEQNRQGVFWLLGAGLLVILGAAGAIFAARPYRRLTDKSKEFTYTPPDETAPAIPGVLRSGSGTPAWSHAQGTLFDLAGRGLISIEEHSAKKWYGSQEFVIKLLDKGNSRSSTSGREGLWPHEQALLELLFSDSSGRVIDGVKLSKLGKVITSSRWKLFSESLKAELKTAGLWSKQREAARTRLNVVGFIFLGLTILSLPLILFFFFEQSGLWALALMVALGLISIAWIGAGSSISIWSGDGDALAEEWEAFYRYLREVAQGKAAPGQPDEFERYLPYAAAYGLLHQWAKRFEKKGWSETPAYFRTLSASGESNTSMAAFVAMTAVTSSSGGSAAGAGAAAGAAGAAGGGASGAG